MQNLAVIIPSKTDANAKVCIEAVRLNEPLARIILIDDGLRDKYVDCEVVNGHKPFIFARNVNMGIRAAGEDDVVILGDDAILETCAGFSLMQKSIRAYPEYGLIASTTNCVGNRNQFPKGVGLRQEERMVCFVAVVIPRRTINAVGLLDERFMGYGLDDDDYCLRVRKDGLKLGIHDGCFVDHNSLPSSFRGPGGVGGDFRPNLEIFKRKWGMDNHGNKA